MFLNLFPQRTARDRDRPGPPIRFDRNTRHACRRTWEHHGCHTTYRRRTQHYDPRPSRGPRHRSRPVSGRHRGRPGTGSPGRDSVLASLRSFVRGTVATLAAFQMPAPAGTDPTPPRCRSSRRRCSTPSISTAWRRMNRPARSRSAAERSGPRRRVRHRLRNRAPPPPSAVGAAAPAAGPPGRAPDAELSATPMPSPGPRRWPTRPS